MTLQLGVCVAYESQAVSSREGPRQSRATCVYEDGRTYNQDTPPYVPCRRSIRVRLRVGGAALTSAMAATPVKTLQLNDVQDMTRE